MGTPQAELLTCACRDSTRQVLETKRPLQRLQLSSDGSYSSAASLRRHELAREYKSRRRRRQRVSPAASCRLSPRTAPSPSSAFFCC